MRIDGFVDIADQFDGFLIDQFGVIHDGQKLYSGALQVLERLHQLKKPVVVMTNSGKRANSNVARLQKMGIPRDYFVDAMSSGEVAFLQLKNERCYLIGRDGDDYGFDGITFTPLLEQADLVLVLGSNIPNASLADYENLLKHTRLPMLCCNPDKQMLTPQGLQPAPGAIADLYAKQGGKVKWIGKPYPEIYQAAHRLLGNPQRVLCVGDSAEHDVAGGKSAGFQTLLVMTGVSADLSANELHPIPDYWMKDFAWTS